jgi:hypothetical protein
MLKRPLLFSLPMGLFTWVLIGVLKSYVPPSATTGAIFDALSFPGALASSLIYPEGAHTGHGAPGWAWFVLFSNLFFYILFWYICLHIVRRVRDGWPRR